MKKLSYCTVFKLTETPTMSIQFISLLLAFTCTIMGKGKSPDGLNNPVHGRVCINDEC